MRNKKLFEKLEKSASFRFELRPFFVLSANWYKNNQCKYA